MKRRSKIFLFGLGVGLGFMAKDIYAQTAGLRRQFGPVVLGWLANGSSIDDLVAELEASGKRAEQQLMDRLPSEKNYKILVHVIGIERWGQSRLNVALGAPFILDDYERYRPRRGLSWNELQDSFQQTRALTIQMAERIAEGYGADATVPHNEFGDLTPLQWLVYLRNHANIELWKMN